jgi:hypothetical protein
MFPKGPEHATSRAAAPYLTVPDLPEAGAANEVKGSDDLPAQEGRVC